MYKKYQLITHYEPHFIPAKYFNPPQRTQVNESKLVSKKGTVCLVRQVNFILYDILAQHQCRLLDEVDRDGIFSRAKKSL